VFIIAFSTMKKIRILFFIAFSSFLVLFSTGCKQKKSAVVTQKDIDSVSRIPDPAARLHVLDKMIKANPNNASLYFERAKTYDETGNIDTALSNVKTAIVKDSSNAAYYFYMSDLFMKKPSPKNAINVMERLAQSQPKNKMAYIKLAELYIAIGKKDEKGKYEESLQNIEKALKLDPNLPEAYFWLGYNYKEMNMTDKAIASFSKAVALKPDYEDAYVYLGLLSEEKKDPKASEYFTTAIRLNPKDTAAIYARGKHYQDIDSFQKAIDDYRKILDLDPGKRNANYGIGYCLYYLKKYDDALGYFSKVLLINPQDAAAHYSRSLCYEALGQADKAKKEKEIADKLYSGK
jgi:tetratricopeptide (TPR) repeat protein